MQPPDAPWSLGPLPTYSIYSMLIKHEEIMNCFSKKNPEVHYPFMLYSLETLLRKYPKVL